VEFLQIFVNVLTEIGGGGTDPDDEYARHLLPMIMWAVIFTSGWSLNARRPSRRANLLIYAVVFGFFLELIRLIYKVGYASHNLVQESSNLMSAADRLYGPLEVGAQGLMFILLAGALLSFMPLKGGDRFRPKLFLIYVVNVMVTTIAMSLYWWRVTSGLSIALWRLTGVYQVSKVSRIAWIPFGLYMLSQLLNLLDVATGRQYQFVIGPIANNLFIWATPWFGYVYWRELIEEQQGLALRLHQAERLDVVGRLAAGVAHDFNNHLQGILGFAEVGRQQAKDSDEQYGQYDRILEAVERSRILVKQLMAFRRDKADDEATSINLPVVVQDLAPMLNGLLGGSIEVFNDLDPNADWVHAERSMLEQAIVNVVINARDAMPSGGTLTVSSKRLPAGDPKYSEPMIRLTITDTGKGMTAYEKERVFEPFFTTKDKIGGSGLGLASSILAIRGMGGEMDIITEVGKGTTLLIDLPAAGAALAVTPSGIDEDPDDIRLLVGTERILFAEDQPGLRHIVSNQLKRAGYDVVLARDGEQAIELLNNEEKPFDLALFDVMMPRKDGYTAFREARELCPDLPVVFVTANADPLEKKIVHQPHLTKPFKQRDLLKVVRSTLDKSLSQKD